MNDITIAEYRDKLMRLAESEFPKESRRFLSRETQKLRRQLISAARDVPVSRIPENTGGDRRHLKYHKSFKVGKTYRRNLSGALSKRVYNASRHGWFVESGRVVARGYKKKNGYKNAPTSGLGRGSRPRSKHYYVYRGVEKVFTPVFNNDCIKFAEEMLRR